MEVEQAFKEHKGLTVRPVSTASTHTSRRMLFLAFVGYCLLVTLKNMARDAGARLTPRAVIEKFAAIQMVDVHLLMSDGRGIVLPRRTQSDDGQRLLHQLGLYDSPTAAPCIPRR